jgi:hypothetical protein
MIFNYHALKVLPDISNSDIHCTKMRYASVEQQQRPPPTATTAAAARTRTTTTIMIKTNKK